MDTEYTKRIICPYCGYEDHDSWEFLSEGPEYGTWTCSDCGKDFYVEVHTTYLFTTTEMKNET